jgi:hypothetical protein
MLSSLHANQFMIQPYNCSINQALSIAHQTWSATIPIVCNLFSCKNTYNLNGLYCKLILIASEIIKKLLGVASEKPGALCGVTVIYEYNGCGNETE